jgi:hypothetical protein
MILDVPARGPSLCTCETRTAEILPEPDAVGLGKHMMVLWGQENKAVSSCPPNAVMVETHFINLFVRRGVRLPSADGRTALAAAAAARCMCLRNSCCLCAEPSRAHLVTLFAQNSSKSASRSRVLRRQAVVMARHDFPAYLRPEMRTRRLLLALGRLPCRWAEHAPRG